MTAGYHALVPQDANPESDLYVRDLTTGSVRWASRRSSLSGDGTHVVFVSTGALSPGAPTDGVPRSYVRDLTAGTSRLLVGTAAGGLPRSTYPVFSADGRHVSFTTRAALLPGDTNSGGHPLDVYVATIGPAGD